MSRLVIVSNRVGPLTDEGKAGGLAVGIADALRRRGGVWFGWSGEVSPAGTYGDLQQTEVGKVTMATLDLTEEDLETFYSGFSNATLWPILHYRVDLAEFEPRNREGYDRVNWRMAARLLKLLKPDDTLWIHDYHFFPLGRRVREAGFRGPMGFFLHVPFPPFDLLRAIPDSQRLFSALLAYDLVGFQTPRDVQNFRRFALAWLGAVEGPDDTLITPSGRSVTIDAFPIGIDAEGFAKLASSEEARGNMDMIAGWPGNRKLVVGVDRLDYSKGIPERFAAFERVLLNYPENSGKGTSLLQIAPLSRTGLDPYADLRADLEETAGNINGKFGSLDWTPIRIITRGFTRAGLAGIYRASDVGLVTPLRDGMNLVAKEFVAAQDPDDPGVLVLSEFAGAAYELTEALIVNPHDTNELANAIQRALTMPLEERRRRHASLLHNVRTNTAEAWCRAFLDRLSEVVGPAA